MSLIYNEWRRLRLCKKFWIDEQGRPLVVPEDKTHYAFARDLLADKVNVDPFDYLMEHGWIRANVTDKDFTLMVNPPFEVRTNFVHFLQNNFNPQDIIRVSFVTVGYHVMEDYKGTVEGLIEKLLPQEMIYI